MSFRRFLFAAAACLALAPAAWADPEDVPGESVEIVRWRNMIIPVPTRSEQALLMQMFVSADRGKTWNLAGSFPPARGGLVYMAPRDGHYWFLLQTIGLDGTVQPAILDWATPDVKVRVASGK